jgi:hypothetical protein
MAGHSRSKNGVASLAYVTAIHVSKRVGKQDVDGRNKSGHDGNTTVIASEAKQSRKP